MSRRVLVARLDSAGDVLLAGPAVRAVARSGARVTMLVSSRGRPAAELLPGAHDVLVLDAPWVLADPPPVRLREIAGLLAKLRRRRLDEALVLTSFHQSPLPLALLLRMAGVPRIAAASEDYPGSLLDLRVALPPLHEAERGLALAQSLGYEGDGARLRLTSRLPDVGPLLPDGPYVVVHPGSDAPARQWPAAQAREAVQALAERGLTVLVTGGGDEVALTGRVAGSWGRDLGGCTSLAELAAVLRGAEALVVGNTGPAHLAAAVGTPVVSLFAPTVAASQWGPYGVPTVVLGDQQAPCAGSRARHCDVPGHPCLADIGPDEVVRAVEGLLAGVAR